MKMSEEMAVRLHRMMWSDMQKKLGDNPSGEERLKYKSRWIAKHFPGEPIASDCWLCEYASSCQEPDDCRPYCRYCPIRWPGYHCNTTDFSYQEEPISDILALPVKNKELVDGYIANDEAAVARSYYEYREQLLSKASGRPAITAIDDHVKAIQEKAVQQSNLSKIYGDTKMELAKASGLKAADTTTDHIKMIQEKAVEEYFEKTPGAKLATMDVDQAFKQYADEQKAAIFRALAEASGLSAGNESVKAHISEISSKAKSLGRKEKAEEIFTALSVRSGVTPGNWNVRDHVEAIMGKAQKPMESLKTANTMLADKLNMYKDALSKESNLDRNRPFDDHIKKIRDDAFSFGEDAERERIMDRIGELLNHDLD